MNVPFRKRCVSIFDFVVLMSMRKTPTIWQLWLRIHITVHYLPAKPINGFSFGTCEIGGALQSLFYVLCTAKRSIDGMAFLKSHCIAFLGFLSRVSVMLSNFSWSWQSLLMDRGQKMGASHKQHHLCGSMLSLLINILRVCHD